MIRLDELFEIRKSKGLELNALEQVDSAHGVPFVSRTSSNNGISAYVKDEGFTVYEAGTISVALGGTLLESFIQDKDYVTGRDMASLRSKVNMTIEQKQFYCLCIRANKYRYNYGRQANRTLGDILVPDLSEIPKWVSEECDILKYYEGLNVKQSWNDVYEQEKKLLKVNDREWKKFKVGDLFSIQKGGSKKELFTCNKRIPLITSTTMNNGVSDYVETDRGYKKYKITVSANGECCDSFWQDENFDATSDVNILSNPNINIYSGMFISSIMRQEKYRFGYGRKLNLDRIKKMTIMLPVKNKEDKIPDYEYMENYIKCCEYSINI